MSHLAFALISAVLAAAPLDPVVVLAPRPADVAGTSQPQLDLSGKWQFFENYEQLPADDASGDEGWKPITVPGHWITQGFQVPKDTAAGYRHRFSVPEDWKGQRVKLRFDAVYSDAEVRVNGQRIGRHVGGFTPFEFDITDVIHFDRENVLEMSVKRESPADLQMTTFGTAYDKTPLGGINRKVTLFAVPQVHLARIHLHTTFGEDYGDAVLHVEAAVANEGPEEARDVGVTITLQDPSGRELRIEPAVIDFANVEPGRTVSRHVEIPVISPAKWDCEHPNLYTLACQIREGDKPQATVKQRFGFRQVEVQGKRLLVNGRPVKLRGVCRHEMDAAAGRVNSRELSWRDVKLFRDANINLIRTSHYPPSEALLDACDELGMFVEEEAPYHHAHPIDTPEYRSLFLQQTAEMIERDRNRPSVIIWSLGNESDWSPNFAASAQMVWRLDSTRPRLFAEGYGHFKKYPKDAVYHSLEIASWHYPGMTSVDQQSEETEKPLLFDEYCHGNSYNREEAPTDPGLRDQWGECLEEIWERMEANEGCLGGAIWGGIDEVWHFRDGTERGWGRWGLLDSWHRRKPEYWHTKKVYSPIHVRSVKIPEPGSDGPFRMVVENRHDFTNLNELSIRWTLGEQAGEVTVDAEPHTKATLKIRPDCLLKAGDCLRIDFRSSRGFVIDSYQWVVSPGEAAATPRKTGQVEKLRLSQDDRNIVIENGLYSWSFDRKTGMLLSGSVSGSDVLCGGPTLMLLPIGKDTRNQTHREGLTPWTAVCEDWKAASVVARETDEGVEVRVEGQYQEANGSFRVVVCGNGAMIVDYGFVCRKKIEARQVGVVFDVSERCNRLAWHRDARWTVYPDDHIGRPVGSTESGRDARWPATAPGIRPTWPWAYDESPLGTNDFRATRTGIRRVSLVDKGGVGLRVISDGTQAARAWLEGGQVRLLVADFSRGTGEGFLRRKGFTAAQPLVLKPGSKVEGSIRSSLVTPNRSSGP